MVEGKSFFVDTTRCTACRGCQIACKQWNQRVAEKTVSWGSHQNPPDLSYWTWKLVRYSEVPGEDPKWYFFGDQCRHCVSPPCKIVADDIVNGAISVDEDTGAVLYNPKVKLTRSEFKEIRGTCPYDIPRIHPDKGIMAKCTMCVDRVQGGWLPACVKACPTGAMNFGLRKVILERANKRLSTLKRTYKDAMLADPDDVRVIFLLVDNPKRYHKFAIANNTTGASRQLAMKRLHQSAGRLRLVSA